jgi:hypothetical protein
MTQAEHDRITVNHAIESRDAGYSRMRFSRDPDTTERLRKLRLDQQDPIPRWRRLLRWLFRI